MKVVRRANYGPSPIRRGFHTGFLTVRRAGVFSTASG
jgi:hypothetical protein